MRRLRDLIDHVRATLRPRRTERDLQDELESHLAIEADELRRRGHESADAARLAVVRSGRVTPAMDALRDQRGLPWLSDAVRDVRYACRGLMRARGLTTVASISLALGIGASTIIFSIVDAALLRPLPYRDADRLVELERLAETRGGDHVTVKVDGRQIEYVRAIPQVFEGVAAYSSSRSTALVDGLDVSVRVGGLAPGLPELLGAAPQLGRAFAFDDVSAADALVISDAYWRRAFDGDPDVIGTPITFVDGTRRIVGVMPPTFRYFVGVHTDAWKPIADGDGDQLVARLRSGLTVDQAQQELDAALARPDATWRPLRVQIRPGDWNRAGEYYGQGARSTAVMLSSLLGAVGLLLAIGCANAANLLLSRTVARQREIAVRRSLGATRGRVARQLLAEGLALAGIGTAAAAVVAWWGIRALPAVVPADLAASVFSVGLPRLDARTLAFGALVSVLSGLWCGSTSAARASASDVADDLLTSGQRMAGSTRAQRRVHGVLQTMQVAMTVVLLAGAGLLLTSVYRMTTVPLGFDPQNLGSASFEFEPVGWIGRAGVAQRREFLEALVARLRTTPGIADATVGWPPVAGLGNSGFRPEGLESEALATIRTDHYDVASDYFRLAGMRLLTGRVFDDGDTAGGPPVAIVSESTARRFWPDGSWIGQRFHRWNGGDGDPLLTVVGVVADVRTIYLKEDGATFYLPNTQSSVPYSILFRTSGDMAPAIASVRAAARSLEPRVAVTRVGSVEGLFLELAPIGIARFYGAFVGAFAAIALTIAMIGLYGTLSYAVSRRTHEIGVRLALGASAARIRRMMAREVLMPVVAGLVAGVAAALWLSRFIASQLFQVTPRDPVILGAIVLLLIVAAAVAAIVPVRRASRVEPATALRAE